MKSVGWETDDGMIMEMFKVIDGKDQLHMRLTYSPQEAEEEEPEEEMEPDEPEEEIQPD